MLVLRRVDANVLRFLLSEPQQSLPLLLVRLFDIIYTHHTPRAAFLLPLLLPSAGLALQGL